MEPCNMSTGREIQENSDEEDVFHGRSTPVDISVLFSSIEAYVLSVPPTEMASTSCIGSPSSYSHIMYYPTTIPPGVLRPNTPLRPVGNEQPRIHNEVDELSEPDASSDCDSMSIDSSTGTITMPEKAPSELTQLRRSLRSARRTALSMNVAVKIANRAIKYARCVRNKHEGDLCCHSCGMFPVSPVTGPCGHTRCTDCIKDENVCPCGGKSWEPLHVNILIRDLIKNMNCDAPLRIRTKTSIVYQGPMNVTPYEASNGILFERCGTEESSAGPSRHRRRSRALNIGPYRKILQVQLVPMSPWVRFKYAIKLMESGLFKEAAPHLALAAASCQPELSSARNLLEQTLKIISGNHEPRLLTKQLNQSIRKISSVSWIKPTELECILCCEIFTEPVTTPCGHMFCRICIERTMDYNKRCPLCLRPLDNFKLSETRDTVFVQAALRMMNVVKVLPPPEPDLIPIFVCTVAYPSVPCPLFIFDPRYWLMVRRVLESGSRRFGMVACNRDQNFVDYGTILEVRDCVHLEDGRSILSTIGLSRFKVMERTVRHGCEFAKILPINDVKPVDLVEVCELNMLATQIMCKALVWLNSLNPKVMADIEAAFGKLPPHDASNDWWETTDGPSWLWWLVAVLPLNSEIKVLILSTDCLLKRMLAVSRTLEFVNQVTLRSADFSSSRSSSQRGS